MAGSSRYDAIVVGGGHNGLVAATLLGRAGRSVLVLERGERVGGAAVSAEVFPGALVSRYAYLVSLFPRALARDLGITVELRRRQVAWYAPGLPVGGHKPADERLEEMLRHLAQQAMPTLTQPLRGREEFRKLIGADGTWEALFERPLSELLEPTIASDVLRGVVLTDGLIGTFAPADDPQLRQNRCFFYHVVGGPWDVPVGGMGAISAALERAAREAGAEIRTRSEVTAIEPDGVVSCDDGTRHGGAHVLANVAPRVLARLMGEERPRPEGSQLKINMLLSRLPRVREPGVSPEQAFTGTFHVNEGYEQLQRAYEEAAAGRIPTVPPAELYCHSLTDPSILAPELQRSGAQALTLFGLHMPARLFADDPAEAKRAAVAATLGSVNSVLAEPIEECLALDREGEPCLEAHTPLDLEAELGMPGGHIFHGDLRWPFAESEEEIGQWGVETSYPNVWMCGSGARRGGCVSGIAGHNAARAVLAAESRS